MGDISAEPSMEDILSSIKRIIAEEGDAAVAGRNARRAAAAPRQPLPIPRADAHDFARDEVLELSDPVRSAAPEPTPPIPPAPPVARAEPPAAEPPRVESLTPAEQVRAAALAAEAPAPSAPVAEPAAPPSGSILSPQATQATRGPLEALSRMVVKPDSGASDTLEGLVREMLRPMLREWLDAKLPTLVEQMVAKEIARITGQQ